MFSWLKTVSSFATLACISQSVATELRRWLQHDSGFSKGDALLSTPAVKWFYLGADISNIKPFCGISPDASELLSHLAAEPVFLMVGTIEPRIGYLLVLDASESNELFGWGGRLTRKQFG